MSSYNDNEHIIERIKTILTTNKSLNQKDLSAYLKKAPSTISQWITQNRDIPAECIIPICEYLGCSVNWLLSGTDTVHFLQSDSQEQKLINDFRMLPVDAKEELLDILAIKLKHIHKSEEKNQGELSTQAVIGND